MVVPGGSTKENAVIMVGWDYSKGWRGGNSKDRSVNTRREGTVKRWGAEQNDLKQELLVVSLPDKVLIPPTFYLENTSGT